MLELEGQIKMEEMCFCHFLKMGKDWIEFRSFHQMGTVNEKVCESDFVPLWDGTVMRRSLWDGTVMRRSLWDGTVMRRSLWDGTVMRRSLAERKLLEVHKSEVMNSGKAEQSKHQCLGLYECSYW